MKINVFWDLMSAIDQEALDEGDEDSAYEPLIKLLAQKSEDEINLFQEILAQTLHDIDGKAWCDESGESADAAEDFFNVRSYVVAKGKDFYEEVLNDPEAMPKTADQWAPSIMLIAPQAWAIATDDKIDNYDFEPSVEIESGSNEAQW